MHIHILPLHSGRAGVQQRTVVNGEKALSLSLWGNAGSYYRLNASLAYYNTDNSIFNICESRTGSFVCCPIATIKVLFPIQTTVCCWTPACPPCNRRMWMCAPNENSLLLYQKFILDYTYFLGLPLPFLSLICS